MKRFLLPLAAFAVLVGFLAIGLTRDPRDVPSPLIGKPAPAFTLPQLHDAAKSFSAADMKGRVWLLNVWASWCVACREEHPVLVEFAKTGQVPIIGLDYKDKVADARQWLDKLGNPYTLTAVDADQPGMKHTGPITSESLNKKILPLVAELSR